MSSITEQKSIQALAQEFVTQLRSAGLNFPSLELVSVNADSESWYFPVSETQHREFLRRMIDYVAESSPVDSECRGILSKLAQLQREDGYPLPMFEEFEYLAIESMRLI